MDSLTLRSIRYLTACYEADQRDSALVDLFHRSVKRRFVFSDEEFILQGVLQSLALPSDVGELFAKEAAIYRRERRLVYGAPFFVGPAPNELEDEQTRLCGPLFIYDAVPEIDTAGSSAETIHRVRIETESVQLNTALLQLCVGGGQSGGDDEDRAHFESWIRDAPVPPFDTAGISELVSWLSEGLAGVKLEPLYQLPSLVTERALSRKVPALAAAPAAALALVENSPASRGSLFELREIGQGDRSSAPLEALFSDSAVPDYAESARERNASKDSNRRSFLSVPTRLSKAQEKVLCSASEHSLSLIVGPPGTGKSYSVASLAVDQIANGRSVLVACRNDQALNVIADKLEQMLKGSTLVLRGGSPDTHRKLKRYIDELLGGELDEELETGGDPRAERERLNDCVRKLSRVERCYERRAAREQRFGELFGAELPLHRRFERAWLEWRLSSTEGLSSLNSTLTELEAERILAASALLWASVSDRLRRALVARRQDLARFLSAIRARTSSRQERFFEEVDFSVLLESFPLWMVTFRDLHRVFPLQAELFDLVIVDEATQCDMASSLPALYRAKRAALTGDPKQLSHVSFLSRARQRSLSASMGLAAKHAGDLDYRGKSLLHRVQERLSSQNQVGFLREHYRSMPQIIEFSNDEFYGSRLRIMTSRPQTLSRVAVDLRPCAGARDSKGVNQREAEALLEFLNEVVGEQSQLGGDARQSIGILSPFRAQVDFLGERLVSLLDERSIERHRIVVGTAHAFQGDERDLVLLSLALDDDSHPASFRYLNQADVFNVSITRARGRQVVFYSMDPNALRTESLLRRYLNTMAETRPSISSGSRARDEFVDRIAASIRASGFRVWPEFPVAGTRVDLLMEKDHRSLGVDLVGFPSPAGEPVHLERLRMLQRAGLPVVPLGYYDWCADPKACLKELYARFATVDRGTAASESSRAFES